MPLEMNQNVFITCAITGSGDTTKSDKVPITPAEIAEAAIDAAKAGAAVACHVRNPDTGRHRAIPLFREVTDRIRSADTDMVLNLTAGMGETLCWALSKPIAAPRRRHRHGRRHRTIGTYC